MPVHGHVAGKAELSQSRAPSADGGARSSCYLDDAMVVRVRHIDGPGAIYGESIGITPGTVFIKYGVWSKNSNPPLNCRLRPNHRLLFGLYSPLTIIDT